MNKTKNAVLLITILGIGLFLRIYNLNRYDFWFDESLSLLIVKYLPLGEYLFKYAKFFTDSELFNILLYFWVRLVKNEVFFRLLPLIFGVLSIILIYPIGKRLFNKETGLISAFLLAISPFHIYYSQELRSYSLFLLLSLLSVYFLVRILRENKLSLWAGFIFVNVFCLYAHKSALFLLLTENIYFLFSDSRKRELFKWLISQVFILLFSVPFFINLAHLVFKMPILSTFCWVPKPSAQIILYTFNVFNLGYRGTKELYLYGSFIFFPIFLFGVWKGEKEKRALRLLLYWIFMPIIMVVIISLIIKHGGIYINRTFIFILPAYLILIANGIKNITDKRFSLLFLSLIAAASIPALLNYYNNKDPYPGVPKFHEVYVKNEYKAAANYIRGGFQNMDIVVHISRSTMYPFLYYHNNEIEEKRVFYGNTNNNNNIDRLMLAAGREVFSRYPYFMELSIIKPLIPVEIKQALRKHRRIWLVDSAWDPLCEDREGPGVKRWLDKNLSLLKKAHFKGIGIYLYEPKRANLNQ